MSGSESSATRLDLTRATVRILWCFNENLTDTLQSPLEMSCIKLYKEKPRTSCQRYQTHVLFCGKSLATEISGNAFNEFPFQRGI